MKRFQRIEGRHQLRMARIQKDHIVLKLRQRILLAALKPQMIFPEFLRDRAYNNPFFIQLFYDFGRQRFLQQLA